MNKKQTTTLLIAIGLASVMVAYVVPSTPSYEDKINALLTKPQPGNETRVDRLAELGPDAVPAISSRLLQSPKLPAKYIKALEKIGDKRAVMPLLKYLEKTPLRDEEGYVGTLALITITALRSFHDPRAIPAVLKIFNDPSVDIKMRLVAAGTLAQISDGATLQMARDFIIVQNSNVDLYYGKPNVGFKQTDIIHALIAADSEASLEILLTDMGYGPNTYNAIPMINYFATKDRQDVFEVLLEAIKHPDLHESHIRLQVLEVLVNQTHRMDTRLLLPYLDEYVRAKDPKLEAFNEDIFKKVDALRKRLLAQQ
ncbi:MAG: hypothetical protein ACI8WB_004128 [Phenylobacterium sp.]|jgi:hypothetical protein